nr:putative integron gene cassette protein [uncultured bacterium]
MSSGVRPQNTSAQVKSSSRNFCRQCPALFCLLNSSPRLRHNSNPLCLRPGCGFTGLKAL